MWLQMRLEWNWLWNDEVLGASSKVKSIGMEEPWSCKRSFSLAFRNSHKRIEFLLVGKVRTSGCFAPACGDEHFNQGRN